MLYSSYANRSFLLAYNTFRRSSAVEHSTVNRLVVGSNPTGGANECMNIMNVTEGSP